ncbi:MAG: hypothetical protein XXXJIFNMEKO3_03446 [Candidatus Erwinia impunctatus]|nr:hypothetical protein XXXJIFNMEKO_03446 [Culicoides impunctatus]
MKKTSVFILLASMSFISFGSLAQNITARAPTIDSAEALIAEQAKKLNAEYKIIATLDKNGVYMVAKIIN